MAHCGGSVRCLLFLTEQATLNEDSYSFNNP